MEILKDRISQLEENYHFNVEEYSFIYKDRKAFIINLSENLNLVQPFLYHRKDLDVFLTTHELKDQGAFDNPQQMTDFFNKCMGIIGNMLDDTKMGSIENYMDHIWKSYDKAIDNTESMIPMQKFINDLSNIITMIDYAAEVQLSSMEDINKEGLIVQAHISKILNNPNLKIVGISNITPDGSIKKIDFEDTGEDDQPDLRYMKPLNTKEI